MSARLSAKRSVSLFAGVSISGLLLFQLFRESIESARPADVNPLFIAPFVGFLAAIALMPFVNNAWWSKNYPLVAYVLGFVVLAYYVLGLHNAPRMLLTLHDYTSFVSLIGSLFVVAGGIHISVRGRATPLENLRLFSIGALLANIIGTTGASMILIRPFLRMNKYRIRPYHIVFFIFIVSNIGGSLTPIGDPPLFLGYLKGIPFFWIIGRVWEIWLLTLVLLFAVFFVIDRRSFSTAPKELQATAEQHDTFSVQGISNGFFLIVILGAVFIEDSAPLGVREVIMWSAALGSYFTTKKEIHDRNEFDFHPIKEVAILFAGIFATMVPALDWLEQNAVHIGITGVGEFYWGSGVLSSVLDNAPTYLNFLSASFGLHGASLGNAQHVRAMIDLATPESLGLSNPLRDGALMITLETWRYVQAVSIGAVFFGAMTYIGNGPNFMVRSIAEHAHTKCPSFLEYVYRYSVPILLPIFALVWLLFFR
jgi:Na+/H+ antiporter NhaD/arsenite permease-like protein